MSMQSRRASRAESLPAKPITARVPEGAHSFVTDVAVKSKRGDSTQKYSCDGCYHVAPLPRDL